MDYGRNTPANVRGYGGLGGASENPVAGFMQGYGFVNDLNRQNAADARAQTSDDLRNQILQGQIDAQNTQKQAISNQNDVNANKAFASFIQQNPDPDTWTNYYSPDEINKRIGPILQDPRFSHYATQQGRDQFKQGYSTFMSGMPNQDNGGNYDQQKLLQGFNQMYAPQINQGTGEGGRTDVVAKQVNGIVPAQNPGQFYVTVKTDYADGTSSVGPWTMNRTGAPTDTVKPFDLSKVMDTTQYNAAVVHYLDQQNAKLGDPEALKRMSAQSENQDLLHNVDQLPQGLPAEQQRQAITRAALQSGRSVGEATALGANLAVEPKDKTLDDAGKAASIFGQNVGYLYDDPAKAAGLANLIGDKNPVLSGQLQKLSQIQDKDQYNAAVDDLRTKAQSMGERAALATPKYGTMNIGDQTVNTSQLPWQPATVLPGTARPNVKPAMNEDQALAAITKNQFAIAHLKAGGTVDPQMAQDMPWLASLSGKKVDPEALSNAETAMQAQNEKLRTYVSPRYGGTAVQTDSGAADTSNTSSAQNRSGV